MPSSYEEEPSLVELLRELASLASADHSPFPFDDCRNLLAGCDPAHRALAPDLDYYFSELAGYRSHGRSILTWPDEKIERVRESVGESFLDRHPIYTELFFHMSRRNTPDLSEALEQIERTRVVLDLVLAKVQSARRRVANR